MGKLDRRLTPRYAEIANETLLIPQDMILSHSLLDVSEDGLAFSYSNALIGEKWIGEEREIDLIGDCFSIEGIPIRIISDSLLSSINIGVPCNVRNRLRRCGVQFTVLNTDQRNQLNAYLKSLKNQSAQDC